MISIQTAAQIMMLRTFLTIFIITTIVASVLAVLGLKELIRVRKLKNAVKKGLIQIMILTKGGKIKRYLVKPDSPNRKDIDNNTYFLDDRTKFVEVDDVRYKLDKTAVMSDAYGIPTWIFFEGNAIPINAREWNQNIPYLNANFVYNQILEEAAAFRSPIEKYFKTILIILIGIAGLVLLLAAGAH